MTIDRAHAAEDEYFRNQEADRQREGAWELQRIARVETAKLEEIEAGRVRQAARSTIITHRAPRAAQRGLNRLIVASFGELLALEEATRAVPNLDAQRSLTQRAERRRVVLRDLSGAVVALGGVPAKQASLFTRGVARARSLRRLLTGPHQGDAYAACVQASERTGSEYSRALRLSLADDVRFGIERQSVAFAVEYGELRRLRWM
jgi:hypothetical protein